MKLTIDNLDGLGPRDYTASIDAANPPHILRRLNKPAELRVGLVGETPEFIVPANGARVTLGRTNGTDVFTGYVAAVPEFEYLGWGDHGPMYRYRLLAISDEILLDRTPVPNRASFVARTAGDALCRLTENLLPNVFDTTAVDPVDLLTRYQCSPAHTWSEHAAQLALRSRAAYQVAGGKLSFAAIGSLVHTLPSSQPSFSRATLHLKQVAPTLNDVVVTGAIEPQAHVTDYFLGDNLTAKFYLSQQPFNAVARTLLEEEYKGSALDPTRWEVAGPFAIATVAGGKLQIVGGGSDGSSTIRFVEKIELGGAYTLQHGDLTFTAASSGILGGLYSAATSTASCFAGFRVTPSGSNTSIQALVNGQPTGAALVTSPSHRYVLSTRLFADETYRRLERFHSALHPAGAARGGEDIRSDVRVILEIHDLDPVNPGSYDDPSTVLFDGVIPNAPGFCDYVLANAIDLHCSIAFTRLIRAVAAEVRTCPENQSFRTRLVGSLSDGSECRISSEPALQFFPDCVPELREQIVVKYRSAGRAISHISDPNRARTIALGADNGVRGGIRHLESPVAWTAADCDNAALALLDDCSRAGWRGEYQTWSDFLPSPDIFPGDMVRLNSPQDEAVFEAIVREVDIEVVCLRDEHSRYTLRFADDAAEPLSFGFASASSLLPANLEARIADTASSSFLADLASAQVTQIFSTSVTIDAGLTPPPGSEIEVRSSDYGWGLENDRNLLGRFLSRTFTLPRLGRTPTYYLRQHDNSSPARYSRYSAALHIDYPYA